MIGQALDKKFNDQRNSLIILLLDYRVDQLLVLGKINNTDLFVNFLRKINWTYFPDETCQQCT